MNGKNTLVPSEEIKEPVPVMGIPGLDVGYHSMVVNYVLSKWVEEVYVSPLEPHLFAVSPKLEPVFAIWRNVGTVTRPTLKAALQYRDDTFHLQDPQLRCLGVRKCLGVSGEGMYNKRLYCVGQVPT